MKKAIWETTVRASCVPHIGALLLSSVFVAQRYEYSTLLVSLLASVFLEKVMCRFEQMRHKVYKFQ